MTNETGGPAFPVTGVHYTDKVGMTLLDYFAGQALPGAIKIMEKYGGEASKYAAVLAYDQAEAMLAERKRRGL